MSSWIAEYWYIIVGVVGGAVYISVSMYRRQGTEPFLTRLVYSLAPVLDPLSEERKSLTPRALVLFAIGLAILGLAIIFVPGFAK